MLVCLTCGSKGEKPKTVTPGSFLLEVALWLLFILPGVIYSIWRLTARHKACSLCGGRNLVPEDTPAAKQFLHSLTP